MQKIVLFIEPNAFANVFPFATPSKIGNLFMNRFSIDEDERSEILKIYELNLDSMSEWIYPIEGMKFREIIDDGVKTACNFGNNDLLTHFIFCSHFLVLSGCYRQLKDVILTKMGKYGMQSSILTLLDIERKNLITKEKMKAAYKGKLKNDEDWAYYEGSINDDLESFLNIIQQRELCLFKYAVECFHLPKLSKDELKLVEEKNREHMMTYWYKWNADVDQEEMKKSDSKDKYVHTQCLRWTVHLDASSASNDSKVL